MMAEQTVRGLWPLWSVILALFVVLSFGFHTLASPEVFWIGVAGFAAALGYGVWYARRHFRWVSAADAVDRLDRSMPGRPLTATFDDMAIGADDEASRSVWQAHILRTKKRLAEAKAVEPDLKVADRDPFALRYAALLFFGIAVLFGSIFRLGAPEGVLPGTPGEAVIAGPSWEAWIEAPQYTGLPTIYLNDVRREAFEVPVGSEITMRLYGQLGATVWSETVSGAPKPLEPQSAFTIKIAQSGDLTVADQTWAISARADQRPKVWFQGAIERSVDGEMKMPFNASDDYGVESGTTSINLDLAQVDRRYGLAVAPEPRETFVLDLPMPINGERDNFSDLLVENMAEHPWAGLNVSFSLDVLDAAGQNSEKDTIETTLPARRFFQPIAAALVEQRRDLLWSRENAKRVGQILRTITFEPDGFFPSDVSYLRVKRALARLETHEKFGLSPEIRDEIAQMLWDVATALEEGRLADALERLRQAREQLSQAMRDGASDEEISELMQELQEAMRQYMEQLAQEGQDGEQQQGEGQEITQDQIQEMLDKIEELMKEGRTAEAEQLLQELMEMMENMQVTQSQQGQGQQSAGEQAMEGLGETLRDQQGLSDEAFRDLQEQFNPGAQAGENEGNEGRNGGQGRGQSHEGEGGQGQAQNEGEGEQQQGEGQRGQGEGEQQGSLAERQERLRDELNRQRAGPLPGAGTEAGDAAREALERAERAMERAEGALRDNETAEALGAQSDAMEALREGLRNLGEAMAEQRQQGQQGTADGQFADAGRDPLGREPGQNGRIGTDESLLSDELAQRRSRELLDEIRRRSGEQQRPEVERDYLKRLLDQF
ncbi:DUF4175 domain-containing protein [Litoreibacter sp.]|nr:DUF4175 domain-containing protein [Litoreibacter sp.]